MSSKKLTQPQNAVLEKGFNFAITPKFMPKLNIISGGTVRDEAAVHIAHSKVSEVQKSTKPSQRNITYEEEVALRELKQDESIVIFKVDKGNATVVINATEYNDKINCLLRDTSVYTKLSKKSNPMSINTYRTFLKIKKMSKINIIFTLF